MKNWIDSLTLSVLAFSAGYLARDLAKKSSREDVREALAAGKDKLRARVDALLKRDAREEMVIEIEREDGSTETVDPDTVSAEEGACEAESSLPEELAPFCELAPAGEPDSEEFCADMSDEAREYAMVIRDILAERGVRFRNQTEWSQNSGVIRICLQPELGTSVRSVLNHMDEISLALQVPVRLAYPLPGKPMLCFEIPRRERTPVLLSELWEDEKYRAAAAPLTVPMGVDVLGETRVLDLARAPHLLVAGTTGSGKSMFINSVLVSLMRNNTPDEVRLLLIDPKMVEYTCFAGAPHLLMPVVTDWREAVAALNCMVAEMERRYDLMQNASVRNILQYNELASGDPARERMPYIVVAIDELLDLKMACPDNAAENAICRLAQKARAAGIHVIVGTQRTAVDVITGRIKASIGTRVAFRVVQQSDSRTVLDQCGAETLVGRGDALFVTLREDRPVRMQCPFISEGDVASIVSDLVGFYESHHDERFVENVRAETLRLIESEIEQADEAPDEEVEPGEDPKFMEALALVVSAQKAATSLLQRRLGIGYGRAAGIIDRMEELGYIEAPCGGNRPRKVLLTQEELDRLLSELTDDSEE